MNLSERVSIIFADWLDRNDYQKFDMFEHQSAKSTYKYQRWAKKWKREAELIEESDTWTTKELYDMFFKENKPLAQEVEEHTKYVSKLEDSLDRLLFIIENTRKIRTSRDGEIMIDIINEALQKE